MQRVQAGEAQRWVGWPKVQGREANTLITVPDPVNRQKNEAGD
jgi:hypothetical protein